ncbi:hypothetical protein SAMN04487897_110116 [Paenibacillus sp. yr247]|uniref:hypothetical protein n=1 Tax=Paenibacillus sp. yr247 TaxID=1761880 RepID=UPI00088214DE|nr:hypothetical protein [Paenibacillus sp. yr247]SDO24792.1 hypothetical protein SAMN04487897_110116 [Paenibacillus sp. yr247]
MFNDNQQVVPIFNQFGYHYLPYYDSACETLQPYPYTYQYNGYRYLNPHVYHLPLIYQQYAYHPLLWEQLYPYRQLPAIALAVAGGFLGIAIYVWEKYFQEEVSKHGDAFKKCAEANPYDFDAIQFCLKNPPFNLSEKEALRVRNRFELLYKLEMPTPISIQGEKLLSHSNLLNKGIIQLLLRGIIIRQILPPLLQILLEFTQ